MQALQLPGHDVVAGEVRGAEREPGQVVQHRLATAETSDLVIVFDEGRVVAEGTHAELLRDSDVYRRLHDDWAAGTTLSDDVSVITFLPS